MKVWLFLDVLEPAVAYGAVARIHEGRVAEMRIFLDREQTLRAAGLSADGAAP